MTQDEVIARVLAELKKIMPEGGEIFNISFDFVRPCPGCGAVEIEIEHRGRRTMVVTFGVTCDEKLVARGLATLLLQ